MSSVPVFNGATVQQQGPIGPAPHQRLPTTIQGSDSKWNKPTLFCGLFVPDFSGAPALTGEDNLKRGVKFPRRQIGPEP
jgi:hypothetical protein